MSRRMLPGSNFLFTANLWVVGLSMPVLSLAQDTTERPPLPSWSIAADDGAPSTWSNPANLALDPDASWMVLAGQNLSRSSALEIAAIQNQGPLATGIIHRGGPDHTDWTTISTGIGIPLDRKFAMGVHMGWQLPEGSGHNFVSWDVGMSWRPLSWMGVSGVARNLGIRDSKDIVLTPTYGGGVAFRPWEDRIFIGLDALWEQPRGEAPPPVPYFLGSLRLQLVDWLQVRVSGDLEGAVGAGLQVVVGRTGFGAHTRIEDSSASPEALFYASSAGGQRSPVSRNDEMIAFNLDKSYPYQPMSGFFGSRGESYLHLLERIRAAVDEPDTPAIFFRIDGLSFSMAQILEVQALISEARESGKLVVAYLDGDGSNGAYMLASVADRIYMHPAGTLDLVGLSTEIRFFRETLDLIGIEPQFARRAEYKSGPEGFTENAASPGSREQMEALLDDLSHALKSSIADGRSRDLEEVKELIDEAPFTARVALERGLIDGIVYPDELEDLEELVQAGLPEDYVIEYDYGSRGDTPGWKGRKAVAVVYVVGTIISGESQTPGLLGRSRQAGSDTIVRQLDQAAEDDDVVAVVVRVDSPGGSSFASDEIWHAIERLKEEDKPVVISMGGLAASGGYYVSAGADAIFALPTTITGSIGVYGGKFSTAALSDKLGIRTEIYSRGRKAAMWTTSRPWDDVEFAAVDRLIEEVYAQFKEKVELGRDMDSVAVELVARGRVWSGTDAQHIGLVDELGGFYAAVEHARVLAEVDPEKPLALVTYPDTPGPDGNLRQTLIRSLAQQVQLPPLPPDIQYLMELERLQAEGVWLALPYHLDVH